jgi:hypothetical protein
MARAARPIPEGTPTVTSRPVPLQHVVRGDRPGRLVDPSGHEGGVAAHPAGRPPGDMARRRPAARAAVTPGA